MHVPEFRYMAWAKRHASLPRYHLARSGLAPPEAALLEPAWPSAPSGLAEPEVPEQARQRLSERWGVDPQRVILCLGTSHAVYLACRSLLRPGDLALVERPTYEVLASLPALCGARVGRIERDHAEGFRLPADLPERIRAERPRLVVLSNPHNPTATWLPPDELAPVVRALDDAGGKLLVDEVYLEFAPHPEASSALQLGDGVVAAASLTKAHGLGAWRFGWLIAAEEVVVQARRYDDYIAVNYPTPSAACGLVALGRLDELRQRARRLCHSHAPLVEAWVAGRPDVSWHRPDVGAMSWLQLREVTDTRSWTERLLERFDTLVVPGEFFDAPGWIRLGFGVARADLEEGLRRIGQALDEPG